MNNINNDFSHLPTHERRNSSVKSCVDTSMRIYFEQLNGEKAANLYKLVIGEAEFALLERVMEYTKGNQSKASEYLGINRGTLRKKLKEHQIEG
jgi:Fis family transcriptional regulator, factor for inversion stimulation protein